MNVLLFLLISLLVHSIPIPFSSDMVRMGRLIRWLPFRLVWGTIAWIVICLVMAATLPWAVLSLLFSLGLLLLVSGGVRPSRFGRGFEGVKLPVVCLGMIIVLVVPLFSGLVSWTSDVSNATFFNSMIQEKHDALFSAPIPDERVRLVTEDYATYVAKQHLSPFGSNVVIASAHITTRLGKLVWVCTIVSSNVLAENYVKGFIVVDANNPQTISPVLINQTTIPVGEGLFWDRNINFGNYLNDMSATYQYAYPTWDPTGNMVYVQTRTPLGFDFVERAIGPIVYCENGTIVSYDSIQDTPYWITQAYAEEWLERQVSRWGGYRRGSGFDLFAGGFLWFVPPSSDRLQMSEDTRYILNPDTQTVEAFIAVHPVTSEQALAGIFRATRNGVYYYDLSSFRYISGEAAKANVISQLPLPATGSYYGAMPLLYPVEINSTLTTWTWYCPIYWADGYYDEESGEFSVSDMRLHALALVDASNVDKFYIQELGGVLSGPTLVQAARVGYVTLLGGTVLVPIDTFQLTANVVNKTQYVEGGDTHIVLGTNNSTCWYVEGTRSWMNLTDWYTLLNLGIGDSFTATIHVVDGQFRIMAITKN
ncbi:MAG: hypothetical protein C4K49_09335 [Candidatus Thorarchaeota archaeon]|nr:MAG: hypothetical protein C4K49_09335 [Candidatus Thorarchaeota archaeon]